MGNKRAVSARSVAPFVTDARRESGDGSLLSRRETVVRPGGGGGLVLFLIVPFLPSYSLEK